MTKIRAEMRSRLSTKRLLSERYRSDSAITCIMMTNHNYIYYSYYLRSVTIHALIGVLLWGNYAVLLLMWHIHFSFLRCSGFCDDDKTASGVAISTGVMGVIAYQRMLTKAASGEEGCYARAAGMWSTPALGER